MWGSLYTKRLTQDLDQWVAKGWVTSDNANAIRASLDNGHAASRLPTIISILGAILISFAAMAFVAANWQDMSKALRLGLLFAAMGATYGIAIWTLLKKWTGFGETALLIGTGLFGANIMLIGQMYHLPSDFSAGMLAWGLGAAVTAWAVRSRSALIASQLIFLSWFFNDIFSETLQLTYLLPWLATTVLAFRINWAPAKHMTMLGLLAWLLGNVPVLTDMFALGPWEALTTVTFLLTLAWIAAIWGEASGFPSARPAQAYLSISVVVVLWFTQVADELVASHTTLTALALTIPLTLAAATFALRNIPQLKPLDILAFGALPVLPLLAGFTMNEESGPVLWIMAPLILGLSIWLVTLGARQLNRFLVNLGFAAFGAEALFLYFETFGTLLDTAAFFLIGGVFLIAGAFLLQRMRQRTLPPPPASAATEEIAP